MVKGVECSPYAHQEERQTVALDEERKIKKRKKTILHLTLKETD